MEIATKTYSITCTCGEKMQVEADTREEAVMELKRSIDELSLANHAAERHPADDAPTIEEMYDIIEFTTVED
jgi:hypothetical protein